MEYVFLGLLAAAVGEAAMALGICLWRLIAGRGGGALRRDGEDGESPRSGEFERRWREGIDAMMEYDPAASEATRRGADERD